MNNKSICVKLASNPHSFFSLLNYVLQYKNEISDFDRVVLLRVTIIYITTLQNFFSNL